jgi:hypothetical protein
LHPLLYRANRRNMQTISADAAHSEELLNLLGTLQ